MKKRMNNKGFSLVELIVVMAIMAILAVTLAPRLTQYIEKARIASDKEILHTLLNTTVLSLADEGILADYILADGEDGATDGTISLALDTDTDAGESNAFYLISTKTWSLNSGAGFTLVHKSFFNEISSIVGPFTLKASGASASTVITINYNSTTSVVTATLDYDGGGATYSQYSVSSR